MGRGPHDYKVENVDAMEGIKGTHLNNPLFPRVYAKKIFKPGTNREGG